MTLAEKIDHTLLKAEATALQIDRVTDEAIEFGFASVCVNGAWVSRVAQRLREAGAATKACAVVDFPLGAGNASVKMMEATVAAKDGAREIDFVANLPMLLDRDVDTARSAFMGLVRTVRAVDAEVVVKVIIESALLMREVSDDEGEARIEAACRAAREAGCDFVKTSTGMHAAGGATVEAVQLMKKHAGGLKVKAAGGIRTRDDAMRMIEAGADRLGCSAGVAIVRGEGGGDGGY